jgi:5-formyltetrahydrofolate cyclo-ligase
VTDKAGMRSRVQAARLAMTAADREAARRAIRTHVLSYCTAELAAGDWIAAYQPMRTEPGSVELLDALTELGYRVMVPVTMPDRDLNWATWHGPPTPTDQPGTGLLGLAAIADARLVLVPAGAVDHHGHRLGRGGGSYDRALRRVLPGRTVAALLYNAELVDAVPTDEWDVPVSVAVTPAGWIQLTPSGRRNSP